MAESGAAAARAAALRRAQAAERARERARRRREQQRQARLEREARARAARERERVRQVVQPSRQADPRLTLPREQQEGLAGTRSRRNQSRRERREQQRLERVAKRLAAQVARQTAEPRRSQPPRRERDAYPALDALISNRAGRGDLLTPGQFEDWRVREHRFTTAPGKQAAHAPTYDGYLRFVERRRGLSGEPDLRERVARGQFSSPVRAAREREQAGPDPRLYGRLPGSTTEALKLNMRNAIEQDDSGLLDRLVDFIRPGGGLDQSAEDFARHPLRELQKAQALLDETGRQAEQWLRSQFGDQRMSVSVGGLPIEGEVASLGSLPLKAAGQIAGGFLGSPAFAVEFAKDPVGATRGLVETAVYAFQHPEERPGDLIMAVWGGLGAARGLGTRAGRARAEGPRAALRPNPSTGQVPEFMRGRLPGARGRQAVRDRNVISELRAADAAALERAAGRPVVAKVTRDEHLAVNPNAAPGTSRRLTPLVQDEAIRAVFDQTTPAERIAGFERELGQTRSGPTARRLRRKIDANRIVIARGLVEGEPGSIRISPNHPALETYRERVARVSDAQAADKALLGIVPEEVQQSHLYDPGAIIRGQDRVPDEPFHLPRAEHPELKGRLAETTPESLTPGQTYGPYKVEQLGPPPVLGTRVRNIIGTPRALSSRRMSGQAIRTGRYGNVGKLTAREALGLVRYRERLELWKQAVAESKTGAEMLAEINAGRSTLDDWVAVRVKPGTSKAETNQLLQVATDPAGRAQMRDPFGFFSERALENRDLFAEIAHEADQTGQIRFVHKDVGIEPLRLGPRGGAWRTTAGMVNQGARFVTFYLGGPAYVVPNLIGQAGFTLMHQGLGAMPQLYWSTRAMQGVAKGAARDSFRHTLRSIGGTGVMRAVMDGSGPAGWLYKMNHALGAQYARLLDNPWRENAALYEFRLRGKTTPESIMRTAEQAKRDPKSESARIVREVHDAVNENYGAFDRLTDFEKNTLTQLVFIYPWLRASFDYAVKLPVNHPVKAAALALGGTYANDQAREDFIRIFQEQGLSEDEATEAAEKLMSAMPGIFAVGDSAINPLSIALLSTPSELGRLADPFLHGDWRRGLLGTIDTGQPSVSVFMAGMKWLFDRYSPALGAQLEDTLGSFARDYTLFQRLKEGGTKWFGYTPEQAIGGRILGSPFPRQVRGEGLLDSVRRDQEQAAREQPKPAQGYEESRFHRNRESAGRVYNRTQRLNSDLMRVDALDVSDAGKETARQALQVEHDLDLALASARTSANGRMDYERAAAIIVDIVIEEMPEIEQYAEDAFARISTPEQAQAFYERAREVLRERFPWGKVHSALDEQAATTAQG